MSTSAAPSQTDLTGLTKHARNLLAELKATVQTLREAGAVGYDTWDLCKDAADWAMTIPGHPGETHAAYLMVLRKPLCDDDAEAQLRLLLRCGDVLAVQPVEEDHAVQIATVRVQSEVGDVLTQALEGHFWPPRGQKD